MDYPVLVLKVKKNDSKSAHNISSRVLNGRTVDWVEGNFNIARKPTRQNKQVPFKTLTSVICVKHSQIRIIQGKIAITESLVLLLRACHSLVLQCMLTCCGSHALGDSCVHICGGARSLYLDLRVSHSFPRSLMNGGNKPASQQSFIRTAVARCSTLGYP